MYFNVFVSIYFRLDRPFVQGLLRALFTMSHICILHGSKDKGQLRPFDNLLICSYPSAESIWLNVIAEPRIIHLHSKNRDASMIDRTSSSTSSTRLHLAEANGNTIVPGGEFILQVYLADSLSMNKHLYSILKMDSEVGYVFENGEYNISY